MSRNGCFLTSTALAREERVSDDLDAASQGQFPLPRTHWPRYRKRPSGGNKWKDWMEPPGLVPAAGFLLSSYVFSQRPSLPKGPP